MWGAGTEGRDDDTSQPGENRVLDVKEGWGRAASVPLASIFLIICGDGM